MRFRLDIVGTKYTGGGYSARTRAIPLSSCKRVRADGDRQLRGSAAWNAAAWVADHAHPVARIGGAHRAHCVPGWPDQWAWRDQRLSAGRWATAGRAARCHHCARVQPRTGGYVVRGYDAAASWPTHTESAQAPGSYRHHSDPDPRADWLGKADADQSWRDAQLESWLGALLACRAGLQHPDGRRRVVRGQVTAIADGVGQQLCAEFRARAGADQRVPGGVQQIAHTAARRLRRRLRARAAAAEGRAAAAAAVRTAYPAAGAVSASNAAIPEHLSGHWSEHHSAFAGRGHAWRPITVWPSWARG